MKQNLFGKKAVEWYILISLLFLVLSIVLVIIYYAGFFPKFSATAGKIFFGPIS